MIKERILITGSSGFIGTNMLQIFLNKGYEVMNFDIAEPKNPKHISYWKRIDITKIESFSNAALDFKPDYIIHLAARTDLEGKTLNDYSANIVGVDNLLRIVSQLPELKKVIITSSMLVCHVGYSPKSQFDYAPTTLYGESKVETERKVWTNKPNCDWAIIRPTSIWGPWFGKPYRNFFDMIIAKMYFHIGSKGCIKTFGFVENAVYQIEQLLFTKTLNEVNKVFYIGDNPPTNIEEWADEIADELNLRIIRMPYFLIKLASILGDILKLIGINFPITSFRLKNMTTNNIIDLTDIYKIAPDLPFTRLNAVKKTIQWIKKVSRK